MIDLNDCHAVAYFLGHSVVRTSPKMSFPHSKPIAMDFVAELFMTS